MADDRAGDPDRGTRPGAAGADGGRAPRSARPGPPSVPFRIPVPTPATPGRSGRQPTMVPLSRRRGPRLGLRPPGAALVTAPMPTATGAESPAPEHAAGPGADGHTGAPPSAPPPAPPAKRSPVDAVTLPAGRIPARNGTLAPAAPAPGTARPVEPATVVTARPAPAAPVPPRPPTASSVAASPPARPAGPVRPPVRPGDGAVDDLDEAGFETEAETEAETGLETETETETGLETEAGGEVEGELDDEVEDVDDLDPDQHDQPDQLIGLDGHDAAAGSGDPDAHSPAVRHVRAAAFAAALPPAPPPAPPAVGRPPGPPAEPRPAATSPAARPTAAATGTPATRTAATGTTTTGTTTTGTAATPEPRRATAARADQADWAATSAVLASVGAWMATWRRRWTWPRTLRVFTATCAVLVVVVCGLAWGAASWVEAAVRQIGALDPDSPAIQDAAAQIGDQNFLVVGSDSRAGAPASEDAGDAADVPGARTDTIMIVHVPEDRTAVTVVSFPRDLEITRPACERWDPVTGAYSPQMLPPAPRVKLNSAYAAGGPRCVTRAVQELSGLAVNRFLGVDFQGFEGMVDAVRGVPICVEAPITDSVLGPIVPQAGPTVLSGRQALDYVRARHVEGDPSSDYGRIQRQQRFLGALLRSVLSAGTLLDPSRLQGLVEAVSRSTFGENIGSDQLLALSQSLGSLDPRTVTFVTVPTTGIPNERGNEVLRRGEERALFSALIDDRPLPASGAPAPGEPAAPAPAPVDVRLVDARSPAEGAGDEEASDDGSDGGDQSSDGGDDGDDGSDDGGDGSDDDGDDGDDGEERRFAGGALPGAVPSAVAVPSAAAVAERLRAAGFAVVTDADADGAVEEGGGTTIRFSPDRSAAATALSAAVPGAALDPSPSAPGTLTLVLGDDFDGTVRSGTVPAGAAPSAPVNPTITAADASCS